MKKFNMISKTFAHDISSTLNRRPKYFEWDFQSKNNEISFYIDGDIFKGFNDKNDGRLKFLWTLESPFFNDGVFKSIIDNLEEVLDTYELIFTYNLELVKLNEKFKWIPAMGSWIKEPSIREKNKKISMIVSGKKMTPEQNFRFNFYNENINKIDVFGRDHKYIPEKEIGLNDYMFSVCVENALFDTYFTEKVLDCFATGTIPIYKGTRKICNHFDSEGIIFLDEVNLEDLTSDLYFSKINSVNKNLELSLRFMSPEDYVYENYIYKYI